MEKTEKVESTGLAKAAENADSLGSFKEELEDMGKEGVELKRKIEDFQDSKRMINTFTHEGGLRENIARLYISEVDSWQQLRERTLMIWPVIRHYYDTEHPEFKMNSWNDFNKRIYAVEMGAEPVIKEITRKFGLKAKFRDLSKKKEEAE